MQLIDPAHPFYRPVWRRWVIVACVAAWLLFEIFLSGSQLWMVIAGAVFIYTLWTLILSWKDSGSPKP